MIRKDTGLKKQTNENQVRIKACTTGRNKHN